MIDSVIGKDIDEIIDRLRRESFEEKRFLVTGGAGFLGSWICDVLVGLGSSVVCLDNFSTGKMENIDHLIGNEGFVFCEEDVCTFKNGEKFDCILHMASRASPEEYQQNPVETLKANSLGCFNMLELARKSDAVFLFASTSEVYGDAQLIPTPETYWGNVNPLGVRSCYDEGKRFAEALIMAHQKKCGLSSRVARIFNSYGPRLRADGAYGRAVSRFITQALANRPLTVYGEGSQTRSFCYVSDTIAGLLLLVYSHKTNGKTINIGNPEEVTILELAQRIRQITGSLSPLVYQSLPRDDPRRRCPDISKARKLLKWEPVTSLASGLTKTIDWFKDEVELVQSISDRHVANRICP